MTPWRTALPIACLLAASLSSTALSADKIILRDFTVLRDASIHSLDVDGIQLESERPGGGTAVRWDEVERIQLQDGDRQAEADRLLKQVGDPLFRIRTRLEVGDAEGLLEPAENVLPIFAERRSPSAYMVLQAVVWARLAAGKRERAVEPWLLCFERLRSRSARLTELPGERKPQIDVSSGLLLELEPVWFDAAAATQALPGAVKALEAMTDPPPGVRLYVASLAVTANDAATAKKYLEPAADAATPSGQLRQILLAQQELMQDKTAAATDRLTKVLATLEPPTDGKKALVDLRPLAWYWLGRAQLTSRGEADRQNGLLTLARIPAIFDSQSPELSAAALAEMASVYSKDVAVATRLREEIRRQFPASWHARQLRAASEPPAR